MIYTLRLLVVGALTTLVQVYLFDLFSFKLNLVLLVLYMTSLKIIKDIDSSDLSWILFLGLEFLKSDIVGIFTLIALTVGTVSKVVSANLNPVATKFVELNLLLIMYYLHSNDFSNNFWVNLIILNLLFILVQIKNYAYPKSSK